MAFEIYTLDPKLTKVVYFGALVTGFGKGSFIEIAYNKPRYTLVVGADGKAVRVRSRDNSAKITIRLMPGALGNQVMQAAKRLDDFENAGAGPLTIVDSSTIPPTAYVGAAWVEKTPNKVWAEDNAEPREWVLESPDLQDAEGVGV
jgi:hypothetical protein